MVNEFKAEVINGVLQVKPKIVKNGKDITIIIPNLKTIAESKREYKNGKRNIQ